MTYLAVPIAAKNPEEAARQIKAAKAAGAEMLELRTDYLEDLSVPLVEKLIADAKGTGHRKLPIIVTCRDKQQGGAITYPLKLRIDVLAAALKAGAEFIDFEYENFLSTQNQEKIKAALSQSPKGRLILSAHNFQTRFDDIKRLCQQITTLYPPAIPKLVYTANHINDCFDAFDLLEGTGEERIVFCMGQAGLISRIIAKKLNCLITFASLDEATTTAPGQLTIKQLKTDYRYDSINADTQLYGIIGAPVTHSLSPVVHNGSFAEVGANKLYLPLLVEGGKDEFEQFLNNVLTRSYLGFAGFSITIPHKQNALQYVRGKKGFVEPVAEKIGSVNTLLIAADGQVSVYNTDYAGALDAITSAMAIEKSDLKDIAVTIIGAGGAARAVVAGLTNAGAKVTIYNRTIEKADALAAEFGCQSAPLHTLSRINAKIVANCTSIGMHPNVNATAIPPQYLKPDMVVFDTVYNPVQTLLLKNAAQLGAKTISGIEMFIRQAMMQFKLFTGQNANPELMRGTIVEKLSY